MLWDSLVFHVAYIILFFVRKARISNYVPINLAKSLLKSSIF